MSHLNPPTFTPDRVPDYVNLDQEVFKRCSVPNVGDNEEENNGVLYYYDEPLLFAAMIEDHLVVVTLIDQDYTNDSMRDGFAVGAKGWDQHLAVEVSEDLLRKVYNSELPVRALYDQENAKTWFVHKNWCNMRIEGLDRFDARNWYSVYRVWRGVEILDTWKSNPGVYLNPDKKDASQ